MFDITTYFIVALIWYFVGRRLSGYQLKKSIDLAMSGRFIRRDGVLFVIVDVAHYRKVADIALKAYEETS